MELPLVLWVAPVVDLELAATVVELDRLGVSQQVVATVVSPAGQRALAGRPGLGECRTGMSYGRRIKAIRTAVSGGRPVLIHAIGAGAVALASFAARGRPVRLVAEYRGEQWRPWHGWWQVGLPGPTPDLILVRDDYCLADARAHLATIRAQPVCFLPRGLAGQHCPVTADSRRLPLIGIDLDAISWAEAAFFLQTLHWLPETAPCHLLLMGSCRARERLRRLGKLHPRGIQGRIRFARTHDEPDKNWLRCVASLHTLSQASSGGSLLEAMAFMATPVLVSDSRTDLIADCDTGISCAPRNPYALSQRLQALCEQLPMVLAMGERARARALATHDVCEVARRLVDLYGELGQVKCEPLQLCR
jgi:hypothetical protein